MGIQAIAHTAARTIPARAGVGLKADHYRVIVETRPDIGFFEVHAENYMGAGGPPHRDLTDIREHYPLSLHGVGLSIGADRLLDPAHLQRLKVLNDRYEPALLSEHLAWSSHGNSYLDDLLPVPYTDEALHRICQHVDQVQSVLGRQMLLENPSTYIWFKESTWHETDFIREIAQRTGCGLLLDVNNVHVASTNQQWDAPAYLRDFPLAHVQEIHLAGYSRQTDETGRPLLIDSHDQRVDGLVWNLFGQVIERIGPIPTLIEWDSNVPTWSELHAEAVMAELVMDRSNAEERRYGTLD
ncbi:MNIO family bufferin maturase [Achromobacter pestifer]